MKKPTKPGFYKYRLLYIKGMDPGNWQTCEIVWNEDHILYVVHSDNHEKSKPLSQYANLIEWERI